MPRQNFQISNSRPPLAGLINLAGDDCGEVMQLVSESSGKICSATQDLKQTTSSI